MSAPNMTAPALLYPVVLRVEGRPCLVVGGGPVAARKAAGLLGCGAVVTLVAPRVDPSVDALRPGPAGAGAQSPTAGALTVERRPYRHGEAAGFQLVVTATGLPAVDAAVAEDATAAGIWVNSADDAEHCTFLLPSVHREGPVSVAVSTGGSSPALATWLRSQIATALGGGIGPLAVLLAATRRRLRAGGQGTASVDWAALLEGPLPGLVRDGRLEEAQALLAGELPRRS
ncbi:MAG TPA: bifunctional precorrin-2 dehydrogenase/sirohydrochlorin ferrochelatase [Acidimicrobiales bacterium]